ncbi:MAG: hypothetical protein HY049_08460, partial [Acidobacteria bacterium]|nr:hypothetical protein [Acidobacteriota bacterium]
MSILFGLLVAALGWTTVTRAFHFTDWSVIDYVNLPFHEGGHIFFSPFGTTLHILGG